MYPVPSHPTWAITDSSKLSEYLECPRKYFFRYILGWTPDTPAQDLHFGVCWHKAREYQLRYGYDDIQGAYNAFIECYRQKFPPETDNLYTPKDPTAVVAALKKFSDTYFSDLDLNEVVELDGRKMLEVSGTVPIAKNRVIHYRMDSIMRRKDDCKVFSWDHKTTSAKYINNSRWSQQFLMSIQNGTYTHVLMCMFPIESVLGVEFCGTGFEYLKRGSKQRPPGYHITLRRVPAYKTPEQMNPWLWLVNNIIDDIEADMEMLECCYPSDPVMQCFRQNPTSCQNWKGCPYYDYCLSWPNPLAHIEEPPLGFHIEFWNPAEQEASVKLDIEQ